MRAANAAQPSTIRTITDGVRIVRRVEVCGTGTACSAGSSRLILVAARVVPAAFSNPTILARTPASGHLPPFCTCLENGCMESGFRVVFVCTGNTCRSPIAARVLIDYLRSAGLDDSCTVSSRGVRVLVGGVRRWICGPCAP
ncbi:hypothetical protein [Acidipropionibacterium jensenii]|uniref:arsenate reductase/protein-tyrosine-phosphatase family protein n=2 Tax=Acidipropionibacterium jensenii TaxID=1749 RepID=UPI003CCC3F70